MSNLFAARSLMALSLAFHIVFAVVGIAMPLLMVLAEWRWLRTREASWLQLCQRWSKGTAILFAVGAVSGTVLSFELGLLWPGFMRHAGPIVGLPFSMEGFAFFLEAICLGLYLYGWRRLPPRLHLGAGLGVLLAGTLSGVFVVAANAWMNQPTGCRFVDGRFVDIDPIAAMATPMWLPQAAHMIAAAFAATGFGVAGVHAFVLLRRPQSPLHRRALSLALWVGGGVDDDALRVGGWNRGAGTGAAVALPCLQEYRLTPTTMHGSRAGGGSSRVPPDANHDAWPPGRRRVFETPLERLRERWHAQMRGFSETAA